MLCKNNETRQMCVNNKIPVIVRTNFNYIKKHQSQEADNGSKVCHSNNFRKKLQTFISIYLCRKKMLYELY